MHRLFARCDRASSGLSGQQAQNSNGGFPVCDRGWAFIRRIPIRVSGIHRFSATNFFQPHRSSLNFINPATIDLASRRVLLAIA